jgi:ATP-dependent RNA helicase DDX19/DBP5
VTLADQQVNPDSPLYSAKTFEELGLYVYHYFIIIILSRSNVTERSELKISSKESSTWVSINHPRSKKKPFLFCSSTRQYRLSYVFCNYLFVDPEHFTGRPTNMIGQSQSGTGKTAAFVLTMLSRVDFNLDKPQVSVLIFWLFRNYIPNKWANFRLYA